MEDRPTDFEILAQQEALQKEQENAPMVGEHEPPQTLVEEFADAETFRQKCEHLCKQYTGLRRVRRDGNCFIRALSFGIFEQVATGQRKQEAERLLELFKSALSMFEAVGFPRFGVEDFCEVAVEEMDKVLAGEYAGARGEEKLLRAFNSPDVSDYMVCFMRFLTSAFLRTHTEEYEFFIESGLPMSEFCRTEVEPMKRESDQLSIIALTRALGVSVRIIYLDNSPGDAPSEHCFPEDSEPSVTLLYRPGHYDLLYS